MRKSGAITPKSVGIVQTQYVDLFTITELALEGRANLSPVHVAYETYGKLNATASNVILLCHALSGNAHAAGKHHPEDRKSGWWDDYIGPGKPFDTSKYFVVCSNNLGGCDGTTGPSSIDPSSGRHYGLTFPVITIKDIVRVQKALLDHLGIQRVMAVVGGSIGGMMAMQWALDYPHMVASSLIIASTPRLSAQNIAFNAVARQAIIMDPNFNNGNHYDGPPPSNGLALARMMAHITYLSEQGLQEKFGRRLQDRANFSYALERDFAVESYLHYQGSSFVKRFDANTYLYYTKAMEYFDPFPDHDTTALCLKPVTTKFLVISFDTDWRFPTSRSKEIVKILHTHHKSVSFQEFQSPHGHDSFLLDIPMYKQTLVSFLERIHLEENGSLGKS